MTMTMFNRQLTVPVHDECGHLVTVVDGARARPTGECGCGPQRYAVNGPIVYEHVDQDLDPDG